MPYVLLSISIVFEVVGTTMMKLSEGFTVLGPSALTIVAYVVSFSIFVIVLKSVPLGLGLVVVGIYLMNAGSQEETDKQVAAFNEAA